MHTGMLIFIFALTGVELAYSTINKYLGFDLEFKLVPGLPVLAI